MSAAQQPGWAGSPVDRASVQRVIARAQPDRRAVTPGLLLGVLADMCVVGLLGLSMWLIVRAGEQPPILYLTFAIVGVRACAIGRAAFRYAERLASHRAALTQLAELRADTFAALVPRVPGAIESHRRGEVLAAFVDDVDQLQDAPLRVRQPLVVSGVVVALSVGAVALIAPLAALVLSVCLVFAGALAVWVSARVAGSSDRELSAARAALTDTLLERAASAAELAAYDALPMQRKRIAAAEDRLTRVQLRRAWASGLSGALLSLGAGAASLLTLLAVSPLLSTTLTAPLFAAAVIVPAAVFEVFAQVPAALAARRSVHASAARIAALTESPLPAEIPVDPAQPLPMPQLAHASGNSPLAAAAPALLEVRDLEVRHPGSEVAVIRGLSLTLHAGETLVITGPSGVGKSTLALALVRLLDYRGSMRLFGVEARELDMHRVREVIGLCEQAPHLFDADLRQNLRFARDTASDDELLAVLERVGLGEWVAARGGLDAALGERGALVSGGQAQRIALARALLADFPVLILDEPTAGVDRQLADQLLIDLLAAVPADRAVILITHTEVPAAITAKRLELG